MNSARFMGGREYALLNEHRGDVSAGREEPASAALITKLADASAHLLPAVVPGTGPFPDAVAAWTIERDVPDRRFGAGACAVVIAGYLAGMTHASMSLAGADGETVVEGPFSGNADYLQALLAITGRDVFVSTSLTGTSIGGHVDRSAAGGADNAAFECRPGTRRGVASLSG